MDYGPLWSLAVEEHFYLIWPVAVRIWSARRLAISASAICVIEPVLRAYAVGRGGLWWGPYTWLSADALALGALLALFARSARGNRANLFKLAIFSAVSGTDVIVLSAAVSRPFAIALRGSGVNCYSFAVVSVIIWLGTGPQHRLVNLRPIKFVGFVSYGFYLIHVLCLDLYDKATVYLNPSFPVGNSFTKAMARLLVVMVFATAVAYASRVTYEQFFLRMKDRLDKAQDGIPALYRVERVLRQ